MQQCEMIEGNMASAWQAGPLTMYLTIKIWLGSTVSVCWNVLMWGRGRGGRMDERQRVVGGGWGLMELTIVAPLFLS